MELIILDEARKELELRTRSDLSSQGYLLGWKTGPGLFIQKIFCLPWKELLQAETFFRVEENQALEVLGVFNLNSRVNSCEKLYRPLFAGKVFLQAKVDSRGRLKFRASLIDFEGKFRSHPLSRIIIDLEDIHDREK